MTDWLAVRIARREEAAEGIMALELVAEDGRDLPPFEAGSHVDVVVAEGLVRQYSLCNDPAERHRYCLGILRDPASRGGSEAAHARFMQGQTLQISAPRCNFHLVEGVTPVILAAGGIGITPMLSMAHALHRRGTPFVLHYCTRSADRTAFADTLTGCLFAASVRIHHDDGAASQRFSVSDCLAEAAPDVHLYVCGPEGFIHHVAGGATEAGWPPERVHVEHFKSEVSQEGDVLTVVASLSGITVQVAEGVSIANALLDAGVQVPLSCEQGICGTCLVRVIEGTPDHRDQYQTDEEKIANTHITPCCSRALSPRLVLEI